MNMIGGSTQLLYSFSDVNTTSNSFQETNVQPSETTNEQFDVIRFQKRLVSAYHQTETMKIIARNDHKDELKPTWTDTLNLQCVRHDTNSSVREGNMWLEVFKHHQVVSLSM